MNRDEVMARLHTLADPAYREGMTRFGLSDQNAVGVRVPELRKLAREIKKDHALAVALWEESSREAKILATLIDDPAQVTHAQMEAWAGVFDSWEICDLCCQNLFVLTPHARKTAEAWMRRDKEYVKRAGFVLVAKLARAEKDSDDEWFLASFDAIRAGAKDPRNFVKKAVSWALREIGKRNERCREEAIALAEELAASNDPTQRWIGKDTLRDLN
ncbi:DNA alkylation repair protein [Methanofollis aquaemaris]|uniref:DNA alkylation repair protein n=1 Tax=Methanofollis aquaemaris TaxID=126734 RepID=A0A8A3S5X7_9EURY|nr:DNA alkylation repair protein [Methanofollis aquaemaris]QSZ67259.1 DNA alkylation repair protein [Methanofollis aquaemaris]